MPKNFTLSYSVKPSNAIYDDEADVFRDSLEDLLKSNPRHIVDVEKNRSVHTTITGKIMLQGDTQHTREAKAKELIRRYIIEAAKEMYLETDNIKVNFLMMVNGIDEPFEFQLT